MAIQITPKMKPGWYPVIIQRKIDGPIEPFALEFLDSVSAPAPFSCIMLAMSFARFSSLENAVDWAHQWPYPGSEWIDVNWADATGW